MIVPPLTTVVCTVIPRRGSFIFIRRCDLQRQLVHRVHALLRVNPRMRRAPGDNYFRAAHALALRLQSPFASERWLEHQHRVAPSRFLLNRPPRTLAADLFIRRPQKHEAFRRLNFQRAQSVHGEKRQHDPALHIKRARPPSAPLRHPKRHLRKGAERIHRVRVPQHHDLPARASRPIPNFCAYMIPALPLPQNPHLRPAPLPFPRHDRRAFVHSALHVARRFAAHKFPQQFHHRALPPSQVAQHGLHRHVF